MRIIKLLAVAIIFAASLNLFFANKLVGSGEEVRTLSLEIQELEKENQHLKIKVAESSSITNLSERVQAAGFTDTPHISTIQIESYTALNQ